MGPKCPVPSKSGEPSFKRKRTALILENKLEFSKRAEDGEDASAFGCVHNLGESTVYNTIKSADKIHTAAIQSSSFSSKIATSDSDNATTLSQ